MATNGAQGPTRAPGGFAAVGIDHVRLAYSYLADRDLDGYLSLLDSEMTVHCAGSQVARGRDEVALLRTRQLYDRSMAYTVSDVLAVDRTVVAVGHYAGDALHGYFVNAEFCDLYTIAPTGLLLSQKTYFSAAPPA